jgi:hypothetical protein
MRRVRQDVEKRAAETAGRHESVETGGDNGERLRRVDN